MEVNARSPYKNEELTKALESCDQLVTLERQVSVTGSTSSAATEIGQSINPRQLYFISFILLIIFYSIISAKYCRFNLYRHR